MSQAGSARPDSHWLWCPNPVSPLGVVATVVIVWPQVTTAGRSAPPR